MIKYQAFKILGFFLYTFSVLSGKKISGVNCGIQEVSRIRSFTRSFENKCTRHVLTIIAQQYALQRFLGAAF